MICTLKELGTVHLDIVQEDTSKKLWNEYVSRYHYLGYKHPFGTYIRYFITSNQGILGCIMFCGAVNWQYLGMTTGEGLVRKGKTYSTTPKMILVMPLTNQFREVLCSKDFQGRIL